MFCWVTLSSCWIAALIWAAPAFCSRLALEISETSSAVFWMSGTRGASASRRHPWPPSRSRGQAGDFLGCRLAALGELAHSEATTAKPRHVRRPAPLPRGVEGEQVGSGGRSPARSGSSRRWSASR